VIARGRRIDGILHQTPMPPQLKRYQAAIISRIKVMSGMNIADEALGHGLSVALVDKGPLGGTCLNLGCIPSKMLIYAADRAVEIQEAGKLGIEAKISSIDFASIMERMRKSIKESRDHIRKGRRTCLATSTAGRRRDGGGGRSTPPG
jgi:hypothetical protein